MIQHNISSTEHCVDGCNAGYVASLCRRGFAVDHLHGGLDDGNILLMFKAVLDKKRRPLAEWVQLVPVIQ